MSLDAVAQATVVACIMPFLLQMDYCYARLSPDSQATPFSVSHIQ